MISRIFLIDIFKFRKRNRISTNSFTQIQHHFALQFDIIRDSNSQIAFSILIENKWEAFGVSIIQNMISCSNLPKNIRGNTLASFKTSIPLFCDDMERGQISKFSINFPEHKLEVFFKDERITVREFQQIDIVKLDIKNLSKAIYVNTHPRSINKNDL